MRKFIVALPVAALALTVVGCAAPGTTAKPATVTVTASAPIVDTVVAPAPVAAAPVVAAAPDPDSAFLTAIHNNTSIIPLDGTDAQALILAHSVCSSLAASVDVGTILSALTSSGVTDYDAGFFVGAAVPAFCPSYQSTIDAFINS